MIWSITWNVNECNRQSDVFTTFVWLQLLNKLLNVYKSLKLYLLFIWHGQLGVKCSFKPTKFGVKKNKTGKKLVCLKMLIITESDQRKCAKKIVLHTTWKYETMRSQRDWLLTTTFNYYTYSKRVANIQMLMN